jgi:acyl-coenzyme A synthetase/AMP-(fatty) acid ligase
MFTVYCGSTMVYLLSGLLPTVAMLVECVKHKTVDGLMLVPPQIEELALNSEALLSISQRGETMFYAGGDVTIAAGNAISSKMKLITTCGSTEQGFWHTLHPNGPWNPKVWKYVRLHPAQRLSFRHQSEDLFEATYTRNDDPSGYKQSIFTIFPENPVYATGDLFSPHPEDSELWQFRGRADDMQSFITAEKFYPTQMERIIGAHPGVNAVLFVGTRRPRGALLVELRNPSENRETFLDSLWPLVEEANRPVPFTAKITRDMILITDAELPMARSVKGTIERRGTVKLYEERLDVLYAVHSRA